MSQHVYRGIDYSAVVACKHDFQPTLRQIKNLIDLADALRREPPPKFDMGQYGSIQDYVLVSHETGLKTLPDEELTPKQMSRIGKEGPDFGTACGAVACALGTGAYWGIGLPKSSKIEDWAEYGEKVYGVDDMRAFYFLFAGNWSGIDNTPEGAAARILMIVAEGPGMLNDQVYLVSTMKEIRDACKPYLSTVIEPKGATL